MMAMTRAYWLFTNHFTARGNDAETVQLPDLFLMKSKAAAQSPSAKETEALFFTTFDQKTNNEDRLETGACLRQKDAIHKDLNFALFNYLRYRFVHLRLFDKDNFIPKVRTAANSASVALSLKLVDDALGKLVLPLQRDRRGDQRDCERVVVRHMSSWVCGCMGGWDSPLCRGSP